MEEGTEEVKVDEEKYGDNTDDRIRSWHGIKGNGGEARSQGC